MSIQFGFALNANTAAVTDAQGRVTSAVPGVPGNVLTANLNDEPTFQPAALQPGSTIVTPVISGATTKFTGLSGPETNPSSALVLDGSGNVKYSNKTGTGLVVMSTSPTIITPNIAGLPGPIATPTAFLSLDGTGNAEFTYKSGTGSVVMTNTATLTTPVIDGTTSKFTSLTVNTTPTAVVSLDGSGNINYTARTGTGQVVLDTSPTVATPTITGTTSKITGTSVNVSPTSYLTLDASNNITRTTVASGTMPGGIYSSGTGVIGATTYTPTAGTKYFEVTLIGAGGAGSANGAGGGGGAYTFVRIPANPAKVFQVTNIGGLTEIKELVSGAEILAGWGANAVAQVGGSGGVPSNVAIGGVGAYNGFQSFPGQTGGYTETGPNYGYGGASYGGTGTTPVAVPGVGVAGIQYSGAGAAGGNSVAAGGAGNIIITEYYN